MSIPYRIALEIPGEPREAPATFTDFDQGIAACVAYARKHPGVAVRMFVLVSENQPVQALDQVKGLTPAEREQICRRTALELMGEAL